MPQKRKISTTTSWAEIKDKVYGARGTKKRDDLERDASAFTIGLMLKLAREERAMTQDELAALVNKQRSFISRVENDGSNLTLRTLFEIVEKGFGGKVRISIEW